jgi:hypothetical protein
MEKKRILPEIIITELFLVKAGNDFTRTFMGEIRRETDENGNPLLMGEVIVHEGKIWSMASSQEDLMKNMDSICKLKLDGGLHSHAGVTIKIFDTDFYLN